ncbi:MAG: hypothetical protein PHE67_10465 [Campylobacterales bacterium]|nr:hypothetical protein [Campylobacterales bacterium]
MSENGMWHKINFWKKQWGAGLSHKERMRLPLHKTITILMLPCYILQKLFYVLASICRDRRLDREIKKLFHFSDKKIAIYPSAVKIAKKRKRKAQADQDEFMRAINSIIIYVEDGNLEKIEEICRQYLQRK